MNTLFPVPAGQNAYNPNVRMLNAVAESLDTIITPGFVNSILSMGNVLNPTDMLLVAYQNGVEFFYQNVTPEGTITLAPANQTTPFSFTNVQFVAKGGSDLNVGNNLNAPKLTIPAALSAVSAFGVVYVIDSGTYSLPFTLPANVSLYAPNATFEYSASSGSFITLADTGTRYASSLNIGLFSVTGGALAITENGALSGLLLNVSAWEHGPAVFNGNASINADLLTNSVLTFNASAGGFLNVGFAGPGSSIVQTTPGSVSGRFGDVFYNTQTFINQVISQQQETQETVGRTILTSDSNTTINYMNTITGDYILPATGIPVGTRVTFNQLSSGVVEFDSDGISTILSYLNSSPVQTGGLNAVATAEQISAGVWMITGNLQSIGP